MELQIANYPFKTEPVWDIEERGCETLTVCVCSDPTASSDNLARLWCVETGEIKREYSGHQKAVVCLAFNDSVLGWASPEAGDGFWTDKPKTL